MIKVKKIFLTLALLLMLVFSFSLQVFAVENFYYDEIYLEIPDYFYETETSGEGREICEFRSDDETVFLRFYNSYNYGFSDFGTMLDDEVIDYYEMNWSHGGDGYFNIQKVTHESLYNAECVRLDGEIELYDDKAGCSVFMYSTEEYIYVLEFVTNGETEYIDCISDVTDSVYFEDVVDYDYEDYDYYADEIIEVIFTLIFVALVIISVVAVFMLVKKNTASVKKVIDDATQNNNQRKGFELNGKDINKFNERFTVGSNENNFAKKELERERREREKMFD